MGMAASQARYLELTARKTNVEYEGQQINQQRTSLANESSGMFSQLMSLSVPTPPSSSNYTTTAYSFNDGANACTITDVKPKTGSTDYNSTVSYYYNQSVYTGVAKTRTDLGVNDVSGTYWLTNGATSGATNQTKLTQCSTGDSSYGTDKAAIEQIIANTGDSTAFATNYSGTGGSISNIYKYTSNGTTNYYCKSDLDAAKAKAGAATSLTSYYASNLSTKQNVTEDAYVTTASSGRYSTIKLASEGNTTLDVTANTTTDNNAYNDAMSEYNYQQANYEKQVQDINGKTEVIQEEDRTLEMKLRQLDTEQQALSTEMDAVKKVIDKNIESTFKTFSS